MTTAWERPPIRKSAARLAREAAERSWRPPTPPPASTAASDVPPSGPPRRVLRTARPLWDPVTRRFDGPALLVEIVGRGWTLGEFAELCGVSRSCIHTATHSARASVDTVVKVLGVLLTRESMLGTEVAQ